MDDRVRRLLLALADATPAFSPRGVPAPGGAARRLLVALADAAPAFARPGTAVPWAPYRRRARTGRRPRALVSPSPGRRRPASLRGLLAGGAVVVAALFVATVPLAVTGGPRTSRTFDHWTAVLAVIGLLLGVAIPVVERARSPRPSATGRRLPRDEVARSVRAGVSEALIPIARQLGRLATARTRREREDLRATVIPMVLDTAASVGIERARACWFRLTDDEPPMLEPELYAGRPDRPEAFFERGTAVGQQMLRLIRQDSHLFVEDVSSALGFGGSAPGLSGGLIVVPVVVGGRAYGVLTVDSPVPGDISEAHVPFVRLLAHLLGDAFAYAEPRRFHFGL